MSQIQPFPITPQPGLVATESKRTAEGRWVLPWNWARFVRGRPQKMGGWILAFAQATSGIPHCILAWTDLGINRYLAAGTYRKLYVYDNAGAQQDVTPFRLTGTLTNPFSTTSGSSLVSVAHAGHGLSSGDQIIFPSVGSAVGGITALQLTGSFIALTVTDANNYVFDSGVIAGSTAGPGGGTVTYEYEIPVGTEQPAFGLGWGVGPWGIGTWGTARSNSTIVFEARIWSLDHFGKILIASYNGGSVYQFDPTQSQPWPRAQVVTGSPPTDCRYVFVTPERFIIVLRENLVISSSSQADFNTWTPATNNTAWTRTLTVGSKLIGARVLKEFVSLVWTDGALYLLQYTGNQFIYNSSLVGTDCGLSGANAAVCVASVAYWMSENNFFQYDGTIRPIDNVEDIRKYVFDNLTFNEGFEAEASYSPIYNEVWFKLCMFGSITPNYVVVYHITETVWSIHPLTRASGSHYTSGDTRPYMGDVSGFIYQHEVTLDANGVAIDMVMTMEPLALSEGMLHMDIEGIQFDDFQQVGDTILTVNTYDRMTDATTEDVESEDITATLAGLTDFRASGRHIGITVENNVLGGYLRWGKPTAFIKTSGRRR
jgi:hypothetical protein